MMKRFFRRAMTDSLRIRLMLLVLLSMAPVAVLTIHSDWQERQEAMHAAEDNLQRLTNLAAVNESRQIEGARQLLTVLAAMPHVQMGGEPCRDFLQSLLYKTDGYLNFGLVKADGDIICSAVETKTNINIRDQTEFRRALIERDFVVGGFIVGRVIKRPTVSFMLPILNENDDVSAVVFASLDLASLDRLVSDIDLPPNGELITTDASGTILSKRPDGESMIGKQVEKPLYDGMIKVGFGTSAWTGEDNVSRLNAFSVVSTSDSSSFRVTIGVPTADIVAAAGDALQRKLVGLLLVTVAALLAAWFVADMVVIRRVKQLVKTADDIAAGHLATRTGVADGNDEIAHLARRFDTMIRSLRRYHVQSSLDKATLYSEKERAEVTLASIGDAVITTDRFGKVDYMNRVAERLTGWPSDAARGVASDMVFHVVDEESREPVASPVDEALASKQVVSPSNNFLLICRRGTEYAVENTAAPIFSHERDLLGAVLVFRDVTESRKLTAQLSYQASHDALTGLCNRLEFERRLQLLAENCGRQRSHALLFLDLDKFKDVNDTAGHAAGDALLCGLTKCASALLRDSDTFARVGGDEFAVILENCQPEAAKSLAEKLRQCVADYQLTWDDRIFSVGVSIGLTVFGDERIEMATLLNAADCACYVAKASGRNRIQVSQPDDDERISTAA
jgi:diguanylate cyclase (GGDEF)-like protein/PAS domain S-box-containing protein